MAATFAGIATGISARFGGPYHPATLRRSEQTTVPGGDIVETFEEFDCQAQVDAVTEQMRADPRYTNAQVRILILAATLEGGVTSDDQLTIAAGPRPGTWKLTAPIGQDPMAIYHECAGVRA